MEQITTPENGTLSSPLSLRELSLKNVALTLWYDKIENNCANENANSARRRMCSFEDRESYRANRRLLRRIHGSSLTKTAKDLLSKIAIPQTLIKSLEAELELIEGEVTVWADHYRIRIFDNPSNAIFPLEFLLNIVWRSDNFIDNEKTARLFLHSRKLSTTEEFKLICDNSFVEEFQNFERMHEMEGPLYGPMVKYWLFNHEPPEEVDQRYVNYHLYFLQYLSKYDTMAMEYIWSKLTFEAQLLNVRLCKAPPVLRSWLMKLPEDNRRQVFDLHLEAIRRILMSDLHYIKNTLWMWNYVKNFIDEDNFLTLLVEIEKEMTLYEEDSENVFLVSAIWQSASEQLREYALTNESRNIIVILRDMWLKIEKRNPNVRHHKFLINVLSTQPKEFRKDVWFKECIHFIRNGPPRLVKKLITICELPKEDMDKHNEEVMNNYTILLYFRELLTSERFNEFKEFYDIFGSTDNTKIQFTKVLLYALFKAKYSNDLIPEDRKEENFMQVMHQFDDHFENSSQMVKFIEDTISLLFKNCFACPRRRYSSIDLNTLRDAITHVSPRGGYKWRLNDQILPIEELDNIEPSQIINHDTINENPASHLHQFHHDIEPSPIINHDSINENPAGHFHQFHHDIEPPPMVNHDLINENPAGHFHQFHHDIEPPPMVNHDFINENPAGHFHLHQLHHGIEPYQMWNQYIIINENPAYHLHHFNHVIEPFQMWNQYFIDDVNPLYHFYPIYHGIDPNGEDGLYYE